ncbi:hypothetical protein ACUSIJ_09635 [Pseudochelatococcus sp. B33]
MADNNTHGPNVGTEVPGGLFVGSVVIAFVLIVIVAIVNVG